MLLASRSPTPGSRSLIRLLLLSALFGFLVVARISAADWKRSEWRGEQAWESVSSNGWIAVISVERARLIALTPPGAVGENLLFADWKNEISWGGHRFWLGPQSSWSVIWPPPKDWEVTPAAKIETKHSVLTLTHAHTDLNYPELVRTYHWRGDALHCTASWTDARFQGVHILQIPKSSVVRVQRKTSEALPLGYALLPIFGRDKLLVDREAAPAVSRIENHTMILRGGVNVTEKIGVVPQDIVADIGAYRLTMTRGKMSGMSDIAPDRGMLTQVFIGNDESAFVEIEQLTPLAGNGPTVSEIVLEPQVRKLKD